VRLESRRKFELEVDVGHGHLLAEAVEQEHVDVVALQPDADGVLRFPAVKGRFVFVERSSTI
jgi:hypothetical protein